MSKYLIFTLKTPNAESSTKRCDKNTGSVVVLTVFLANLKLNPHPNCTCKKCCDMTVSWVR